MSSNDITLLGRASGFFFASGFFIAKIRYLPIPTVSSLFTVIAMCCYLVAYGLWFIASHLYPEHNRKDHEWYGFAQFKEQYLFAATLGLIATTLSIAAILVPVLIIPSVWLFFGSNLLWNIGEYHKLKNPPTYEKNYSHSYQNSYVGYVSVMSAIGMLSALSATLIFLFPPITIPTIVLSSFILLGLGALGCEYWLDCNFGDHKKKPPVDDNSYLLMNDSLGPSIELESTSSHAPYHGSELLSPPRTANPELDPEEPSSSQTCIMSC